MSNPELRDIIDPKLHYSPNALPQALRQGGYPQARILVVNCSDALTPTHVNRAIEKNYGLDRFRGVLEIQHAVAAFGETDSLSLDGHQIILTTGSNVDLGQKPEVSWTVSFREQFLREAVRRNLPILAPCFGLAQLARLRTQSMEEAFPKGIRVLGRMPLEIQTNHPLFNGFSQLSGYCHHNGSVPLSLVMSNQGEMAVHALTRQGETIVPAMITFNQAGTIIGTEFHRELLEDQLLILYQKKVGRILTDIVSAVLDPKSNSFKPELVVQSFRELLRQGLINNLDQFIDLQSGNLIKIGNIIEWLRSLADTYQVDVIQAWENSLKNLGVCQPEAICYAQGYVANTGLVGAKPYSQEASMLFFDNFLRLALSSFPQ